jgi:hypothetical protein
MLHWLQCGLDNLDVNLVYSGPGDSHFPLKATLKRVFET